LELKANIDKYLQWGFMKNPPAAKKYELWAYQYISDYCVGLSISESQTNDFFRSSSPDAMQIGRKVWAYCSKYDVTKTPVNNLLTICRGFRGDANIKDEFPEIANDGFQP